MKPGQQLSYNGKQVALFPMPVLSVSQLSGPSSFSHCCGAPIDIVGTSTTAPLYAPFDCHLTASYPSGNTRAYTSDAQVITPAGVSYVTVSFTHAVSPPTKTSYKQGELIYYTGTAGMATGDHCHLDVSLTANAGLVSYGVTCSYGNDCWALSGSTLPSNVFYINNTNIISSQGLNFLTYEGGEGGEIDPGGGDEEEEESGLTWIVPEEQRYLTEEEMENNALCVFGYFAITDGWTKNAIAALLANMEGESTINPNAWETLNPYPQPVSSRGYGLVQWTPYTIIIDYLENRGIWDAGDFVAYGNGECDMIMAEKNLADGGDPGDDGVTEKQWYETASYPISFDEWAHSEETPEYLAYAFMANYERPLTLDHPDRQTNARKWYEFLADKEPVFPDGKSKKKKSKKKKKWIYYLKKKIPI